MQAEIRKICPNTRSVFTFIVRAALYCLNLALSKATDVQALKNAIGTTQEVITLINFSAKRLHTFIDRVTQKQDGRRKSRLVRLCEAR